MDAITAALRGMQRSMDKWPIRHWKRGWFLILSAAPIIAGCAMQNPILSSGPGPRAEDCAMIQQATPTKYVCNGKVYTSIQLADIRKGEPLPK
jgi:hypothetical protein